MALMTKEESYAERRLLFKNIWDTAMQIDDKDADIMNKPKVIKTLRLDEVDRCVIGKKKKERLKNLRTVCNKILEFCDRQDADDTFYEQIAEGKDPHRQKLEFKPKKIKAHRGRKKVKKAKSLFVAQKNTESNQPEATTSEKKDDILKDFNDNSNNPTPTKPKKMVSIRRPSLKRKSLKSTSSPDNTNANNIPGRVGITRRKLVKKRHSKRKKQSVSNEFPRRPSGIDCPDP